MTETSDHGHDTGGVLMFLFFSLPSLAVVRSSGGQLGGGPGSSAWRGPLAVQLFRIPHTSEEKVGIRSVHGDREGLSLGVPCERRKLLQVSLVPLQSHALVFVPLCALLVALPFVPCVQLSTPRSCHLCRPSYVYLSFCRYAAVMAAPPVHYPPTRPRWSQCEIHPLSGCKLWFCPGGCRLPMPRKVAEGFRKSHSHSHSLCRRSLLALSVL